jgi:organic radical activating enzyme
MWEEVAKCDLVCANCHRTRTWKRKDYVAAKLM